MTESGRYRWLRAVGLVGAVYFVVGIAFGALANLSATGGMRVAWRLAAWLFSAAAFAAQIAYEHFRLRGRAVTVAWHAALAVALGAFALAVAANIHSLSAGASQHRSLLHLALVVWPAVSAVPAFLVALAAASVLAWMRRGR